MVELIFRQWNRLIHAYFPIASLDHGIDAYPRRRSLHFRLENFDFQVLFFTLSFKCKLYTKKMFLFAVWDVILRK